MPALSDYQFAIEATPWVPFGVGQSIVVEKFVPGGFTVRDQDVPTPTGDAVLFGIDRRTPGVWTWDLWTDAHTPGDALDLVDLLAQVWDADDVRATPGEVVALRYTVAGRTRRVYGRPRRFDAPPENIQVGRVPITMDFQLAEAVTYDDLEDSVTVQISANQVTGRGFTLPLHLPLYCVVTPVPRTEQTVIGGTAPTWLTIDIHGPVSTPWVQIGSQRWSLTGAVANGETVTLSGRSWDTGVKSSTGTYRPEMLDPRSRLSQLRVKGGQQLPVTFGGWDGTGTARAVVRWRNARRNL